MAAVVVAAYLRTQRTGDRQRPGLHRRSSGRLAGLAGAGSALRQRGAVRVGLALVAGKWLGIALWCFPQIALGLSGFELIMTVGPRVRGAGHDGASRRCWRPECATPAS